MRFKTALCLLSFLATAILANAQTVYRCDTEDGVVFSAQPCADDAKEIELEGTRPRTRTSAQDSRELVLYVEFDDRQVVSTAAN